MFRHSRILALTTLSCLIASAIILHPGAPASAEPYIAAQLGVTLPQDLRNIDITTTGFTQLKQTDLKLDNSFLYGGKIGYYFRRVRWLGLESEVYVSNPGVKQQDITLTGPGGSATFRNVPGFNFRVITAAPLNVELRWPGRRLQPYIGAGPAFFFARIKDKVTNDTLSDDWRLGLNAHAGIRFHIVRRLAVFVEGKFSGLVRFKFSETRNLDGFDADYNAVHGVVGISYHF